MQNLLTGWLLLAALGWGLPAGGLELVKDGLPQSAIILSPRASPSEQLAADELAAYLKKMSGAAVPVTTQAAPAGIVIGTLDSLEALPPEIERRLRGGGSDEAFYLKRDGGHLYVVGRQPIGALYGTYTLLDEHLGVRWFFPGELGEYCPSLPTIPLPDLDDFQKPHMATRTGLPGAPYESAIWGARHKLQPMGIVRPAQWFEDGSCTMARSDFLNQALNAFPRRGGHTTLIDILPDALFADHPEWFPLRGGVRKSGGGAGGLQRCLANPQVFERVVQGVWAWGAQNPAGAFTLCAADNPDGWCECAACRALGAIAGHYKHTTLFHRFFSRAVQSVLARNPEARLDIRFYIDRGVAPEDPDIQYRGRNVRGVYCTCWPHARCYAHAFTDPDCPLNAKCLADLRGVLAICPRLYTYEYIEASDIPYAPIEHTLARDIRDLAALGVEGFMNSTHPPGSKSLAYRPASPYVWQARWASIYLTSKLHWNTRLDPEQVLADAYGKYYGAAAPAMEKYHALRRKLWDSAPGHAFYGGPKRTAYCLTVPGAEADLKACLAEAKQQAAGDKAALARIGLDEQFLEQFWKAPAEVLQKRFSAEKQIIPERVRAPLVIDGDLSEATWLAARPATGFLKMNTDQPPVEDSHFRVAYDDASLYIGFVAMNDRAWGPEIANAGPRDDIKGLGGDDHIQLQLAPPGGGGRFYHLIVNTKGAFYDSVMTGSNSDPGYDSQAEIKVGKRPDRFVYELRLPLAPMEGDVSPGAVWGLYAFRRTCNLQPPETRESSSLDGLPPHRVLEFRQAVFGRNVVKNGNFSDVAPATNALSSVKDWRIASAKAWSAPGDGLRLENGTIYSFLDIPLENKDRTLAGEIRASGYGTVSLWTSTCRRPPDSRDQTFRHAIRKEAGPFALTPEVAAHKFAMAIAPYEQGYLYVRVAGQSFLRQISGVLADTP